MGDAGASVEAKTEGFGPNGPGPQGFPLAGARFVGPLARSTATRRASLRAVRLTIEETELFQSGLILL
jgi:hypothetical protein